MLKQLRLKNWRSIKEETIDFTPITVFIGANSSGKSNIIDALRFLQDIDNRRGQGITGAIYQRGGPDKILTNGYRAQPLEIEFEMIRELEPKIISNSSIFEFKSGEQFYFTYTRKMMEGDNIRLNDSVNLPDYPSQLPYAYASEPHLREFVDYVTTYIGRRWQILDEGFNPVLKLANEKASNYLFNLDMIDSNASNLPSILDYMRVTYPETYHRLQEDTAWLLGHIASIEAIRTIDETKIVVREKVQPQYEASIISAGTARIIAMIAAYHILDITAELQPEGITGKGRLYSKQWLNMPGLVVIEEPDTALNPHLLSNFVELLRDYVDREHPRQFILTTHNPRFLDLFEPEEVRVVERDEQGFTSVKRIPDHVRQIWLDKYGLGDVWMTRSLGGVPE